MTDPTPYRWRLDYPDCAAITLVGTRCRREGSYLVLVGAREVHRCGLHTKMAKRGPIDLLPVESLPRKDPRP